VHPLQAKQQKQFWFLEQVLILLKGETIDSLNYILLHYPHRPIGRYFKKVQNGPI